MKFIGILIGGITATGLMTMYSYWYSRKEKKQFREPQLLAQLMSSKGNKKALTQTARTKGWVAHFAVGIMLTLVYWKYWKKYNLRPGFLHGLLIGGATGLIATRVWQLTFHLHPNPPKIDYRLFYIQLVEAHVVFGLTNVLIYRLFNLPEPELTDDNHLIFSKYSPKAVKPVSVNSKKSSKS